jgi:O-antigen ligase
MGELQIDKAEPASEYSPFYVWMISGAALVYVIVAFGLNGIPGLSRLALCSAVFLLLLLIIGIGKLKLPYWLLTLSFFYVYLAMPAFALKQIPFDRLSTMATILIGTVSIGLALKNKILPYKIITYGTIIAAVINILAVHAGVEMSSQDAGSIGRYSGLLANANALAVSMALAAFLIWLFPERFNWQIKAFGIFLALYGLYVTGSMKGVLMAGMLFALVFMNQILKMSKVTLVACIAMIAALMIALYGVLPEIAARYGTQIVVIDRIQTALSGHNASFNVRLSMINFGLQLWKEAPVFGYGLNQYAILSNTGTYAHNNYIELAVSGGLIALMLFYSLHITILRNAMKQSYAFRVRLLVILAALFLIDTAAVSFLDKGIMCMLGVLLAVSSEEQTEDG